MVASLNSSGVQEALARVMRPDEPSLSRGAAEGLLEFRFSDADHERHEVLASKSNQGELSEAEAAELDQLLFLNRFFGILHAKAMLSLAHADRGTAASNPG